MTGLACLFFWLLKEINEIMDMNASIEKTESTPVYPTVLPMTRTSYAHLL